MTRLLTTIPSILVVTPEFLLGEQSLWHIRKLQQIHLYRKVVFSASRLGETDPITLPGCSVPRVFAIWLPG